MKRNAWCLNPKSIAEQIMLILQIRLEPRLIMKNEDSKSFGGIDAHSAVDA